MRGGLEGGKLAHPACVIDRSGQAGGENKRGYGRAKSDYYLLAGSSLAEGVEEGARFQLYA